MNESQKSQGDTKDVFGHKAGSIVAIATSTAAAAAPATLTVATEPASASASASAPAPAPALTVVPVPPAALKVFACRHCAATYFPARSLCAACGCADFVSVDGEQGWIEQWTELRQSLYQRQQQEHRAGELPPEQQTRHYLATVRTAAGPLVIAAMEEAGEVGRAVTLSHEGERLVARRKSPV